MVTISNLRSALATPRESFKTLKELSWEGEPIIRSTLFAEAVVRFGNCSYLLAIPFSAVAMHRMERFCILKRHLRSTIVPPMRIMRDEMLYIDAMGRECCCDVLLEPLPDTTPYTDALANAQYDKVEAENLLAAINRLEKELHSADVSLGNLRKENLGIDNNGDLRPMRWYYATKFAGGDKESFAKLREEIMAYQQELNISDDTNNYYTPLKLEDHLSSRSIIEGLIAVEEPEGWGFVDCNNQIIIKPQYTWVSDFREGRAEVEIDNAMGLIDKMGRYIIAPEFEVLDYDHISGQSRAKRGNEWHIFDYSGKLLEVIPAEDMILCEA